MKKIVGLLFVIVLIVFAVTLALNLLQRRKNNAILAQNC